MNWIKSSMQTRLLLVVGGGLGGLLVTAVIAIALLNRQLDEYHRFISVNIAQERAVSQLNLRFRTQVQEWKNVLLRGEDPRQLERYWNQFLAEHQHIESRGAQLLQSLPAGDSRELVVSFLRSHDTMLRAYQSGRQAFIDSGFDAVAGDRAVQGIDREPSQLLDRAAHTIGEQVAQLAEAADQQSAQVSIWSKIAISSVALLVVGILWYTLKAAFLTPLHQIMGHIGLLAQGDFSRKLNLVRADELGQLSDNLNHMQQEIAAVISAVQASARQVESASREINTMANDIAGFTGETEQSTDQVATAVNEMSSTVQEVASNASGAAGAAQEADTSARKGLRVMEETIAAISTLSEEVSRVSAAMERLAADSTRIGSVLAVIRNVSEQTNLLALNAAIEAARAGEQGRGFAVVADEVRALAQRTQESTREIEQIVNAVQGGATSALQAMGNGQEQTRLTVDLANQAGAAISEITNAVGRISDMNTQIATAAEEQSFAAEEINRNIVQVVSLVQSAHKSAQGSTRTAADLDVTARQLSTQVTNFRV